MTASMKLTLTSRIACPLAVFLALAPHGAPSAYAATLAYISNERDATVTVVDVEAQKSVATWNVGRRPRGITDNAVEMRDRQDGHLVAQIAAGSDPEQFALSRDGKVLFVSNEDDSAVSALDVTARKVLWQVSVDREPEGLSESPDGHWLAAASEDGASLAFISLSDHAVVDKVPIKGRPRYPAYRPDGNEVWVSAEMAGVVHVLDAQSHGVLATIPFAPPSVANMRILPCGIRFTPDGKTALIALGRADMVAVVDVASRKVEAYIKVGARPWLLEITPDGSKAVVANGNSNDVSIIDIASRKVMATVPAGQGAWGVAIAPSGE